MTAASEAEPSAPPGTAPHETLTTVNLSRTTTWGGLPTKSHYTADDLPADHNPHERPGEFPFTRGAFPEMYRSRMWSMREIVGYGSPEDTRTGLERALLNGASGMNVVDDLPTKWAVDPDHPLFRDDVGVEGVSLPSLRDCERLLEGVDLSKIDLAWHSISLVYPLTVAVHVKRGQPLNSLLGSHMPDYLHQVISGWGAKLVPANMALRMTADCVDFSSQKTPQWSLGLPQAYDVRERGVTPAQEIAIGMAIVVSLPRRDRCPRATGRRGRPADGLGVDIGRGLLRRGREVPSAPPHLGPHDEGALRRTERARDAVADRGAHVGQVPRLPAAAEQHHPGGDRDIRGHLRGCAVGRDLHLGRADLDPDE